MNNKKIAVIGCGPAGAAAAIQLQRAGLSPVVFEKRKIGGLLLNAGCVENYPGFPKGIRGAALCRKISEQLKNLKIKIQKAEITAVSSNQYGIKLEYNKTEAIFSYVIAATGTVPKIPLIEIDRNAIKMIVYEPFPLFGKKGKRIGIIGAGDAAYDYALTFSKHNKVTILRRTDQTKCLPLLSDRCREKNITVLSNIVVERIGHNHNNVHCITENGLTAGEFDYIVIAVGREANHNFIYTDNLRQSPGKLFFAGDVKNGIYRQLAIAAGDGLRAAMEICKDLK